MIVLGVDPGINNTGYGIIKYDSKKNLLETVDYGVISPKRNWTTPKKLSFIYDSILNKIDEFNVDVLSLEKSFYGKNVQVIITMSQARAIVILAGYKKGLDIFEYSPKEVKKVITSYGGALKSQVRYMVDTTLNIDTSKEKYDVSDALAIALCHVYREG